jgi:SAM-dependent methyltransferase
MDIISATTPYGADIDCAVVAVGLLVLVLLVIGFNQGREITFWPPRVGARPRSREDRESQEISDASTATSEGLALKGSASHHGSMTLEVCQAGKFYQLIAANYDARNSANLLATHMETIERIEKIRAGRPTVRVLDLGGGTGQNIATHFFNDDDIHWDYVDSCPGMAEQLRRKLNGRRLNKRLTVYIEDINNLNRLDLRPATYHVILLSLVLSSMPELPDFSPIAKLLARDGSLVISDINPDYTYDHRYYEVVASDGKSVAMRMTPVRLLDLVNRANSAGLKLAELTPIGKPDLDYSFIAIFDNASR